jgi:LPS export ABC transporter protein LptC
MPLRSWLALLGLSLLALGIFSLLERLEKQAKQERIVTLPPVDYSFLGVEYSALDNAGQLRVRVSAASMAHARADKTLILINPKIIRFADDNGKQTMNAKQAQVFEQGKRVVLEGRVLMQSRDAHTRPMTVKTNDLTLLTEEKRAFSENAVQIQQQGTTLTGRGLKANFATQVIEIKHDVHTVFQAPIAKPVAKPALPLVKPAIAPTTR